MLSLPKDSQQAVTENLTGYLPLPSVWFLGINLVGVPDSMLSAHQVVYHLEHFFLAEFGRTRNGIHLLAG